MKKLKVFLICVNLLCVTGIYAQTNERLQGLFETHGKKIDSIYFINSHWVNTDNPIVVQQVNDTIFFPDLISHGYDLDTANVIVQYIDIDCQIKNTVGYEITIHKGQRTIWDTKMYFNINWINLEYIVMASDFRWDKIFNKTKNNTSVKNKY